MSRRLLDAAMARKCTGAIGSGRSGFLRPAFGAAALAILLAGASSLQTSPALAQVSGADLFGERPANPAAQMLLEADELMYDEVNNSVAAIGNVQIAYDGYTLVAERVTYERATGRVIATGAVEIVEPNGNRIFADEIDVTDDFQDGFVEALRVETVENTRFIAESAERRDGEIAVFNNGVYTACEPCKDNPTKPPLWQIRANRVIINNVTKTVSYEGASFELYGRPIAYLPKFSHADPSIKRKSGFLISAPRYAEELGNSGGISYFWALAPNYDFTLTGRYFTRQGVMVSGEWRHRTENGEYDIKFAGIDQQGSNNFAEGTIDRQATERGAIMSSGAFKLNPRWRFGWNLLAQSDGNFARTYEIPGYDERTVTNQVYLTGLNNKNYFDLRAQKYLIQDNRVDQLTGTLYPGDDLRQEQQGYVLPSFDYQLVSDDPVAGGQLSLTTNVTNIDRRKFDAVNYDAGVGLTAADERYHGIPGRYSRASSEVEWKASTISNGALFTTSLSARGDAMVLATDNLATESNPLMSNDTLYRGMPAAMFEIRYPMIASDGMTSHIFEPIAQLIVRPDETHIGEFPNEDAQSMVFDASNLFERDKFSGFDRVEGGTRANIGFRYATAFQNGMSLDVVAGQSFHLHGKNSFAERDLVNAGLESGLETDKSDYVASVSLDTGTGLSLGVAGRFDERTTEIRRGEVGARYVDPTLALSGSYIFIDEQPNYGLPEDRHEVKGSASLRLTDEWRLFGSASYDIQNREMFSRSIGISYDDSCTSLSIAYNESEDRYDGGTIEQSITFRLGLRTIGETQVERKLFDGTEEN